MFGRIDDPGNRPEKSNSDTSCIYDSLLYKVPFTSFSLIDLEKPDYNEFPGLKYVKGYDFILQPGDALFMPSRYWHFNTYLEGGMAISYRILASRPADIYDGIMNSTLRLLFDKAMNDIMGEKWMERKKAVAFENAGIGHGEDQKFRL